MLVLLSCSLSFLLSFFKCWYYYQLERFQDLSPIFGVFQYLTSIPLTSDLKGDKTESNAYLNKINDFNKRGRRGLRV